MAKKRRVRRVTQSESVATSPPPSSSVNLPHLLKLLVLFILVNLVVLTGANTLFPTQVVFGTHMISDELAFVSTALLVSLVNVSLVPLIESWRHKGWLKVTDGLLVIFYFVINTLVLWLISRVAEMIGFGLGSWMLAVLLGLALTICQGIAVRMLNPSSSRVV